MFDKEFWFVVEKILLGFDIGYWLEEALKFLSYEIPKESFKYLPCLLYTSPSPRDLSSSRMPSSA